jgi:hypothetical protein
MDSLEILNKGITMKSQYGKIKNKELKKQWLKDLRSGSYNQTQGILCREGSKDCKAKYCCLGVLGRSIQKIDALPINFKNGRLIYKCEMGILTPPPNLRKAIGINDQGIRFLATLNDLSEYKFKKIADWIEENL